jgi:hypothetical protein
VLGGGEEVYHSIDLSRPISQEPAISQELVLTVPLSRREGVIFDSRPTSEGTRGVSSALRFTGAMRTTFSYRFDERESHSSHGL